MNYYRHMDKSNLQIDFVTNNKVPKRLKDEISENGGKIYQLIMRNSNPIKYMKQLLAICSGRKCERKELSHSTIYGSIASRLAKCDGRKCERKELSHSTIYGSIASRLAICNGRKYDIVHAHGNSATLATEMMIARICGIKVRIAHCHSSTSDHMLSHKLLKPLFNHSYTHAFACSEDSGKWLYGKKPFTVINNAIPVTKYTFNESVRSKCRRKLGYEKNKIIGHIGHFSHLKNHKFLIQLFYEIYRQDNSYRLLLIGDGDLKAEMQKQVLELGLKEAVCFYGETLLVAQLLQAMDIFVFPSICEGMGMVVIEAQAAGLPCIVSDTIPKEAKITPHLEFVSLKAPMNIWVNKTMELSNFDRKYNSEQIYESVWNSNYNIQTEAGKLKKLYNDFKTKK